ncbi:uncharacterized protein [Ptychodera flava]|uniref:uncharacterized protein n=1 Tax=Ptychodera flava TaxID=63121 RepID=UPI00396A085A
MAREKKGKAVRFKSSESSWKDSCKRGSGNELAAWSHEDTASSRTIHLPTIEPELPEYIKPCHGIFDVRHEAAEKQSLLFPPIHRSSKEESTTVSDHNLSEEHIDPVGSNIIIGSPMASAGAYRRNFEQSLRKRRVDLGLKTKSEADAKLPSIDHTASGTILPQRNISPLLKLPMKQTRLPPIDMNQMPFKKPEKLDVRMKSTAPAPLARRTLSSFHNGVLPDLMIHGGNVPTCQLELERKRSKVERSSQRRKVVQFNMYLLK